MEIELKKLKDRVKNIETTIGRKVRLSSFSSKQYNDFFCSCGNNA